MEPFNRRVMNWQGGLNVAAINRATKLSRDVLTKGFNQNIWSHNTVDIIVAHYGIPTEGAAIIWTAKEHVIKKAHPTILAAFKQMEEHQEKGTSGEGHFIACFDAITMGRPSFMVTISGGAIPTMLDSNPKFDEVRQAILAAVQRDLRLVYIVPSDEMLRRMESCQIKVRSHDFGKGYERLVKDIGSDNKSRFITHDYIDIASPQYVTALLGETTNYAHVEKRIVERGPAQRGKTMLISGNSSYEHDIINYTKRVLEEDNPDEFTEEFIRRMGE